MSFLMPKPKQQYFSIGGLPMIGGKIYTYAAGTTTPKATFTSDGVTAQPNPIVLNSRGEPDNAIFWNGSYRVDVRDLLGNLVYTVDNYQTPAMPNELSAGGGAGLLGFLYAAVYAPGTIGKWLQDLGAQLGSTFIGYMQAGAGAVLQTIQDWMRKECRVTDFGAKGDGATDDGPAIQKAKTYAEANKRALRWPDGVYLCSSDLVLNIGTTWRGAGKYTCELRMTGTAKVQSSRAATVDFVEIQDMKISQGGTADTGLDIGTLRRGLIQNVRVEGFKIGVSLDIGVSLVANYWNRLINVEAECTGQNAAGSIGFLLGNNTQATYPDTDYNNLVSCKSFSCETAIKGVNMIGCKITGHQATVVGTALTLLSGNNNQIEILAENCTNLGSAAAGTLANDIKIFNDGGNAAAFVDNGWNYIGDQLLAFPTFSNAVKSLDCFVKDRIFFGAVALSKPMFKLNLDGDQGVTTVTLAYAGQIAGVLSISGVAVWDIVKPAAGVAPVAILQRMTGPTMGTASFSGSVMTVVSGTYAVGQTLTALGVPPGCKITSFGVGGGGAGTTCNLTADVGVLTTRAVGAAETIYSVTTNVDGTVTFVAAGHASALLILNTIVEVQTIGGLTAYPYSRVTPYTRLV